MCFRALAGFVEQKVGIARGEGDQDSRLENERENARARCNDKSSLEEYSRINVHQVGERETEPTRVRRVVDVRDDARKAKTSSDQRAAGSKTKSAESYGKRIGFSPVTWVGAWFSLAWVERLVQVGFPGQWNAVRGAEH